MKNTATYYLLSILIMLISLNVQGQRGKSPKQTPVPKPLDSELFSNFELRNIGPAFMSGRIADLAIDPTNESTWYVAVGSGGVWKTTNAGTTFKPIFDTLSVYSTGCITIDPNNPYNIWLGTGENVGGRHASFGDGIYLSENGGESWNNMGLKDSEHISKILVHPENSNVIMVAAQGPLWSKGGQRGFYKSTDKGQSWKKTLGDNEFTGVTDLIGDPRDPNRLYAATWQHHRTVAAYMGGGEKSRIYVSSDAGDTWKVLKAGLPEGKWGKVGLAISPQNPDVLYAAIELNRKKGGIWRSTNRGGSWTKMSEAIAGATGPHYYQELYASPHKFDRIYLMDSPLRMSENGGKTFVEVNSKDKHVDNHAMAFKKNDPNYIMVGTDGGVYESFDLGDNWRYMENLPVTQFYKIAVDDAEPFYNIYGGTQDNSTQGGPSRTDNLHGIRNADWKVVLNWDGHQPATEPGNPNILYAERQEGTLSRVDLRTGEVTDIQPQPGENENFERFNWDAPILVSPHNPTTIFFGSQRLWKSENRGDSWTAISGDLTKNQERITLPIMGKKQGWDSPWDVYAMSNYNSITSISESPKKKGLIYIGTDDGLIQVTEDGGESWRKINVSSLGAPSTSFVNDIKADLHDENTVYVALDNHKYGDYRPFLVKSTDRGVSWTSITNGIGENHLTWRIVQDHINKNLMFLGTEFGLFFTIDGAKSWTELDGGIPTISFRDLAIQKRENDLVAGSFGRGIFVLDDYSSMRNISNGQLQNEASLFEPRKTWWYVPRSVLDFEDKRGSMGTQHFVAPNPDFGALFTYYLKEEYKSDKKKRSDLEKEKNISFPGWNVLEAEKNELEPQLFLEIKNSAGKIINRIKANNKKGFNRVAWNLTVAPIDPVVKVKKEKTDQELQELMVVPGTYTASLMKLEKGKINQLTEPVNVEVVRLYEGSLKGSSHNEVAAFWRSYELVKRDINVLNLKVESLKENVDKLKIAAQRTNIENSLIEQIVQLKKDSQKLDKKLNGNAAKNEIGEKNPPTINERLFSLDRGITRSTYGPTQTHKETLAIVNKQLSDLNDNYNTHKKSAIEIANQINQAGGPWIKGLD